MKHVVKLNLDFRLSQDQIYSLLTRQLRTYNSGVYGEILSGWEKDPIALFSEVEAGLMSFGKSAFDTPPFQGDVARRLSWLSLEVMEQHAIEA